MGHYRHVRIKLSPHLLETETDEVIQDTILHEICHVYNDRIWRLLRGQLYEMVPEGPVREMMKTVIKDACEEQTCDLTNMLKRILKEDLVRS